MDNVRRRALVTGASRGVGAAVATRLAADGFAVAVHCRADVDAAKSVAAGLSGDGHVVVSGDLADPAAAARVVAESAAGLGRIDVLVNNAGIYVEHDITATTYEQWRDVWRQTLDLNLVGTANVTWCVVRHLLDRPEGPAGGRIVTVGSRGAYRGEPTAPAYGASKAGVHALTQSLAVALGPYGIGAAAVAPGYVRTDMTEHILSEPRGDAIRAQSPLGRVAEPTEVASAVAWLVSPDALWASGTVIDVNGASYLR